MRRNLYLFAVFLSSVLVMFTPRRSLSVGPRNEYNQFTVKCEDMMSLIRPGMTMERVSVLLKENPLGGITLLERGTMMFYARNHLIVIFDVGDKVISAYRSR